MAKTITYKTPGGDVQNLYLDILQQPHTLIAGTTGSGKSCVINGIIYTAMTCRTPATCRFVLIDPKHTELVAYKNLPHTWAYCNEPNDARGYLKSLITEMQGRYKRAEKKGLRKSDEFDVYVIIDELSDLVLADREIVDLLGKIARVGRAANIHLIAATQCPNRKTLSAEFSANCPARLALRCRDNIESRQIIGNSSAVDLPMYGQAFYISPLYRKQVLCTIPLYSDEVLNDRIQYWLKQTPRRHFWKK